MLQRISIFVSIILNSYSAASFFDGNMNYRAIAPTIIERLERDYLKNNFSVKVILEFFPKNIIQVNEKLNNEVINSTECNSQFSLFTKGLSNFEPWALRSMKCIQLFHNIPQTKTTELWLITVLDSSSGIPNEFLIGNLKDNGVYDDCQSVNIEKEGKFIRGRHCMYSLSIKTSNTSLSVSPTLSICLPMSCSAKDVANMVKNTITSLNYHEYQINISYVQCSPVHSPEFGRKEVIPIVIFTIIFAFLLGCTIHDVFIRAFRGNPGIILTTFSKFSFYSNAKRILRTNLSRNTTTGLGGIRFFSMLWIIIGHQYVVPMMETTMVFAEVLEWNSTETWNSNPQQWIIAKPCLIDIFFLTSGFLTTHLFLTEKAEKQKLHSDMFFFQRTLRFLLVFIVVNVFLYIYIFPHADAESFEDYGMNIQRKMLEKNWVSLLFFFYNFIRYDSLGYLCHTWYMAADIYRIGITPLDVLSPLAKKTKILGILATFVILSVFPAAVAEDNEYIQALISFNFGTIVTKVKDHLDANPYTRLRLWFLGLVISWLRNKFQGESLMNLIMIWWTCTTLVYVGSFSKFLIITGQNYEFNAGLEFRILILRQIYVVCTCCIIHLSIHEYGSLIIRFLSLRVFIPLGRVSYSIYLFYILVQSTKCIGSRNPAYFRNLADTFTFAGEFIVIIIVGICFSLIFESPILVFGRMIFKGKEIFVSPEEKEIELDSEETSDKEDETEDN